MCTADDIILVETCGACPEQYDAYYNGKEVGYLRLRYGYFSVRCPSSSGDIVYEAHPRGDGIFELDERDFISIRLKKQLQIILILQVFNYV